MASEINQRNLSDLRVSDLREELEKRGLDRTGVKSVLVKRLQQALSEESDNPESTENNSAAQNSAQSEDQAMDTMKNEEMNDDDMQDVDNSIDIDPDDVDPNDMVVKDELDASIGEENDAKEEMETESKDPVKETLELKTLEIKVENCLPKSRPGPASSKLNHSSAAAKQLLETSRAESKSTENPTEQDDSINLTIGEDEEKLLQEADDGHHRSKGTDVKQQSKSQTGNQDQDSSNMERVKDEPVDEEQSTEVSTRESEDTASASGDKKKDDKSDTKSLQADGNSSSSASKTGTKDDKDSSKKSSSISSSRNLWVSGLSGSTRATDLKQVFSKYGKVIGAKVVTSARTPGARCYGYVTMATNEEAVRCMHNLHRTELHGRVVSVERAKSDGTVPAKKDSSKSENAQDTKSETGDKQSKTSEHDASRSIKSGDVPAGEETGEQTGQVAEGENDAKKRDVKSVSKDKDRSSSRKSRSKHDSKSKDRERSPKGRRYKSNTSRERKLSVLSFQQIRAERDKQRLRDRERALREEERRRREEQARNREVERWQREEAQRLAKEREKLQREREKIERERVEILKLERTRQKLERERLEFERMELKRQQMKIEEARMAAKRSALDRRDAYPAHDERKRPALSERRLEAPPPPRFDQVTSSVGTGPGSNRSGGYNDASDVLSSKKRDYNKRDDMRKNESRGGEFKRGGDFDILPRHSGGSGGHMMHPGHASSHQGSIIKYPVQSYDDRGRDNSDIGGSRQDSSSAGPMQSSRSKDTSRYADRSSDRPSDRSSGLSYRGSERDNGRRPVEAPDHRSTSGGNKLPPRSGSRERRYVDTNIKDSGRYNDRPNSAWHTPGGSSSSKPYGSLSSNTGGMNSGQNIVPNNNPWANDTRSKPSSQNQSSAWRQVDSASNDRWARTPLYPPGVSPSQALTGSSSSYIDHRYNMSSMRKY